MKKLLNFILLAYVIIFASCSSDIEDFKPGISDDKITIGVGMPRADTRVSTADLLNMTWEDGDQIILMGYNNGNYVGSRVSYPIKNGIGTTNAEFDVFLVEGANQYKVYYYNQYSRGVNFNQGTGEINVSYKDQERKKLNDSEDIRKTIVLGSDFITPVKGVIKGAALKPCNSVLKVNIKDVPSELSSGISDITWKINNKEIVYCGLFSKDGNGTHPLKLTNGKDNIIYLSFDPSTTELNPNDNFEISFNWGAKKAKVASPKGKSYKSGKVYTVTLGTKDGSWGFLGEAGGSEGGNNEDVIKWKDKEFWVKGVK